MAAAIEYNAALTTYRQAYADYLAALKNGSHELTVSAAGNKYSGGTLISPANRYASNSGDCIALCSRTNTCTGATFNSEQNSCSIYSGQGSTVGSGDLDSYAIISDIQAKLYAFNVAAKNLSDKNIEVDISMPRTTGFNDNTRKLQKNYTDLLQDRQNIDKATKQFNKLNNTNINASIGITASSNQYIIWIIFAILVLSTTFMIFFVPNVNIMETYPAIALFIILMLMYFAYQYFQYIKITYPDLSYYFNSINYYS